MLPDHAAAGIKIMRKLLVLGLLVGLCGIAEAQAPVVGPETAQTPAVVIPNHWDPKRRIERPPLPSNFQIRFLTEHDNPPLNYIGRDGELTGFNVELARALCAELNVATCTIQARAWETLVSTLRENRGDVIIAGLQPSMQLRAELDVSDPYLRSGGRFAVRSGSSFDPLAPQPRRIGVIARSAHAAYIETAFPRAELRRFDDAIAQRAALVAGEVDAIFGDAIGLGLWLNSAGGTCCRFSGGAYLESRFFGEGHVMVVRRGETTLRRALDHALQRLSERGIYAELYLRWFPQGLY